MAEYNAKEKTWTCPADPKLDKIPIGSYLGEAILENLKNSDPDRVVENNHDTNESNTIKDIYERTITAAVNLNDFNLGKDDVVAFFSRQNSYTSSIVFACYLNGTPWCPFDIIQDDLNYLLDYIKPSILIYDKEFESTVKQSLQNIKSHNLKLLVFGDPSANNSVENVLFKTQKINDFKPRDLSSLDSAENLIGCICFTSGSTGRPKGVPITHSMFVAKLNSIIMRTNTGYVPNFFSPSGIRWIAQVMFMLHPIFFEVQKTFSGRNPDAANVCDAIHKWRVTGIATANSMIKDILDHYTKNPGYDFTCIRNIISGGEAPCKAMNARFKKVLPQAFIVHTYGMTEVVGVLAKQADLGSLNGGHMEKGLSVRIVNEHGNNVEHEKPGVIHIKGTAVFKGYYKIDSSSSLTDDGWYITGDYGLMTKDNYLHAYCRLNFIPKCNGKRIIPSLIEEHLNEHYMVDIALMIPAPGVTSDNERVAIFVKLMDGVCEKDAEKELTDYVKKIIDWDIVAKIEFVDKFKTNSTGKADKEILRRNLRL